MKFEVLHVTDTHAGQTLSTFLRHAHSEWSWSQVRRAIEQRRVQINGNLCVQVDRLLKSGEVVRIGEHALAAPITSEQVKLVYVDDQLVIIDKPAGITTLRHAEEKQWSAQKKNAQPTLEEMVTQRLRQEQKSSGKHHAPPVKVRPVHRLDRDTSGLMVFARTPLAETQLIRQFKKHTVERAYIAIVHGHIAAQTIRTHLIEDRGDGLRGSTTNSQDPTAQLAVTHIKPLEQLTHYTVLECRLETGKTHQIRIHLSELGHPLCGEKLYTHSATGKQYAASENAPRQMLHAAVLGLVHPVTKKMLQYVSPLPRDMQHILQKLRESH
jgi:23S rRNA pseudouridine1911/1915/1917 synthase